MIDNPDFEKSTLSLLVFQALKQYSTPSLLPMLTDEDLIVRSSVARELQLRGGIEVFSEAKRLSISIRHENREIAAFLLGQLGTPDMPFREQSIPILKKLMIDDYHEVQSAAISALGHLSANDAYGEICAQVSHLNSDVRESVAFALGRLQINNKVVESLRILSEDANAGVREWALLSIASIDSASN